MPAMDTLMHCVSRARFYHLCMLAPAWGHAVHCQNLSEMNHLQDQLNEGIRNPDFPSS